MRDMTDALEEINITNFERCYTIGRHLKSAPSFRISIPKLMPLIPRGGIQPIYSSVGTCKGSLVNEKKPSMSSTVGTQNYLRYPRFPNSDYTNSNENVLPDGITFEYDTRGILMFPDCNIREGGCFEFY